MKYKTRLIHSEWQGNSPLAQMAIALLTYPARPTSLHARGELRCDSRPEYPNATTTTTTTKPFLVQSKLGLAPQCSADHPYSVNCPIFKSLSALFSHLVLSSTKYMYIQREQKLGRSLWIYFQDMLHNQEGLQVAHENQNGPYSHHLIQKGNLFPHSFQYHCQYSK